MVRCFIELSLIFLMITTITLAHHPEYSSPVKLHQRHSTKLQPMLNKKTVPNYKVPKNENKLNPETFLKHRRRFFYHKQPISKRKLTEKLYSSKRRSLYRPLLERHFFHREFVPYFIRNSAKRLHKQPVKFLLGGEKQKDFRTTTFKDVDVTAHLLPLHNSKENKNITKKKIEFHLSVPSKDNDIESTKNPMSFLNNLSRNDENILLDPKCIILKNTKLGPKFFLITGCMEVARASPDVKGVDFNRITIISEKIVGVDPRQLPSPLNILNPAGLAEGQHVETSSTVPKSTNSSEEYDYRFDGEDEGVRNWKVRKNQHEKRLEKDKALNQLALNHSMISSHHPLKPSPLISDTNLQDRNPYYITRSKSLSFENALKRIIAYENRKLKEKKKISKSLKKMRLESKLYQLMNEFENTFGIYCNLDSRIAKKSRNRYQGSSLGLIDTQEREITRRGEIDGEHIGKKKPGIRILKQRNPWSGNAHSRNEEAARAKRSDHPTFHNLFPADDNEIPLGAHDTKRTKHKLHRQNKRQKPLYLTEDHIAPVYENDLQNARTSVFHALRYDPMRRQRSKFSATFPNKNVTTWKTQLQQVGKLSLILGAVPILLFLAAILTYRCWPRMTFWWVVRRSRTAAGSSYVEGGGDSERQSLDKKEDVLDFDDSCFRKEVRASWLDRVDLSMRNDQAAEINYNQY